MKQAKFIFSIIVCLLVITQAAGVLAAPAQDGATPLTGTVQGITLETDASSGITIVLVTLVDQNGDTKTVRISEETALRADLALLTLAQSGDGNPVINQRALGRTIEIDPAVVLPEGEESQNPVGSALATFFSDIPGVDYNVIMDEHANGVGFGLIAQALWLTRKLGADEANVDLFWAILTAKEEGDYSAFVFEDGTSPTNWGQFRKAVLVGDQHGSLGVVMSQNGHSNNGNSGNNHTGNTVNSGNNANNGNGNGGGNGNNGNNGNGNGDKNNNGNGNGGGNGNGNGNGNHP